MKIFVSGGVGSCSGLRRYSTVQRLSFDYFTRRGVTLAGAKAANWV